MDALHYHNDEPADRHDLLGWGPVVSKMAHGLLQCRPPFVLGLHGDWGGGKTSFLRQLETEVKRQADRKTPVTVVFFQAWQYQFEQQPVVALLQAIREKFSFERAAWEATKRVARKVKDAAFVNSQALLSILGSALGGAPSPDVKVLLGALGPALQAASASDTYGQPASDLYRNLFDQAVQEFSTKDGRLVVLIDDLDRCTDEAVVRLLEGIRLYLTAKHCVFVVAADRRAITRAVANKLFEKDQDKNVRAEDYCEKLFQAVELLPRFPNAGVLVQALWRKNEADGPRAAEVEEERRVLTGILTKYQPLPFNPRKHKRFLSELSSRVATLNRQAPLNWELIVAIQCIQTFHPDVYRIIEAEPSFFAQVTDFVARLEPGKEPGATRRESTDVSQLSRLKLPYRNETEGGEQKEVSSFADPGDSQVLTCARLLRDCCRFVEMDELRRYLGHS